MTCSVICLCFFFLDIVICCGFIVLYFAWITNPSILVGRHMLMIVDNEEFYEKEKPLALKDIRYLITILRQVTIWTCGFSHLVFKSSEVLYDCYFVDDCSGAIHLIVYPFTCHSFTIFVEWRPFLCLYSRIIWLHVLCGSI